MPTLTLYPNEDVSVTMSQYGSGTGNYGRINETTQDDTNGVTTSSTSGQVDLYGLPDSSPGETGDVYACVYGGDIYKQAGGIGDFEALEQTSRNWVGLAATPPPSGMQKWYYYTQTMRG